MRLLDTDTCIAILRGNRAVIGRRQGLADAVATTWVTACELYYGAAKSEAPDRNRLLVTEFLASLEVLGFDLPAAQRFGALKSALERRGAGLADADLMIASVSLSRGAILVTGNVGHYRRIPELQIEDWIRSSA